MAKAKYRGPVRWVLQILLGCYWWRLARSGLKQPESGQTAPELQTSCHHTAAKEGIPDGHKELETMKCPCSARITKSHPKPWPLDWGRWCRQLFILTRATVCPTGSSLTTSFLIGIPWNSSFHWPPGYSYFHRPGKGFWGGWIPVSVADLSCHQIQLCLYSHDQFYIDNASVLKNNGGLSAPIEIQRGVRQCSQRASVAHIATKK